jgi:rhodanese-related sulfurtransferase
LSRTSTSGNGSLVTWTIRRTMLVACIWMLMAQGSPLWAGATAQTDDKLAAVYALFAEYKKNFSGVSNVLPEKAASLLARDQVLFVDVRTPAEMAVSTLPGAIDKHTFLQSPQRYQAKTVVAYCTIGYRSGLFAQEMAESGIQIKNLKGGILAWALKGGQVFDQDGATKRLHVYGPQWDLAPSDYETIEFGLLERLSH